MNTLVHVATHYAIFALPVRSGTCGQALLVPLLLMNSRDDRADLLSLHQAGAISLVRRDDLDISAISRSLLDRGVPLDVLDQSSLRDDPYQYMALIVAAKTATAATIRDRVIRHMRGWINNRHDAAAERLRQTCSIALGEGKGDLSPQDAREFCAQRWNRLAGVL